MRLFVYSCLAAAMAFAGCSPSEEDPLPLPVKRPLPGYGCNFLYGMNYAWHHFGGDFGGVAAWAQRGVSSDPEPYRADFARMRAHGVRVVRWWMFPDLRGESLQWQAQDVPAGVGPQTLADVTAALALADEAGIDVMFTLFSFDGFRPTRTVQDVTIRSLGPLVREPRGRTALLDALVAPVARAVAASPHARRLIAWDVMNEPEWALLPQPGIGGDPPFRTMPGVDEAVSYAQMFTFLGDVVTVLHAETPNVPVSVGSAAVVWSNAWRAVDTDFHHFHIYGWVDAEWVEGIPGRRFAYDKSLRALGLDDKPVVVGEFGLSGLERSVGANRTVAVPHEHLVTTWKALGYAGALSWSFTESSLSADEVQAGLEVTSRVARTLGCDDEGSTPSDGAGSRR